MFQVDVSIHTRGVAGKKSRGRSPAVGYKVMYDFTGTLRNVGQVWDYVFELNVNPDGKAVADGTAVGYDSSRFLMVAVCESWALGTCKIGHH